ncbi:MAG: SusD/RagB family nutrient-binding outer membrane lipoprotein [Ginsengibacter sp.]
MNNSNKFKGLLFLQVIIALLISSCTKNLDELRKDPEAVAKAIPASFLSNALYTATSTLVTQGHTINDQLMQVSVLKQNDNEIHRYIILPNNYTSAWTPLYKPLVNIEEMIKSARSTNDPNYESIGLTLKSWILSNITDIYGDVPFTEALRGVEAITTPKFDPQKQIYDSIFVYLERANNGYVLNKPLGGEDLLFNATSSAANMMKWKKFTNSLRLRLLMRVEKKGAEYTNQIKMILSDPSKYPMMQNVSDGAALYYTGITPFLNPFFGYRDFDFNQKLQYSAFFIDYLKGVDDPRLPVIATKTSGGEYLGVPTGYPTSQQSVISNTSYSTYQPDLKSNDKMGSILQYAEVEFLLSEAALKGYSSDDPKVHYDNGIKASMNYWGITSIPSDFLNNPEIAYDGTLEQIMTQKYFALFGNGFDQWFEYRRTGFPVMVPGPEMANDGMMPSRIPYPLIESIYNLDNYNQAVTQMGGDDINVKVWWQK